jgi:glycosyltransferase involved in cell wall biosynthesis
LALTHDAVAATVRPRIVFVINSLGQGGAERALDIVLSHPGAPNDDYESHLVLLDDLPEHRAMPAHVIKHVLDGRGDPLRSTLQLSRILRRLRPALVVSLLVRANLASSLVARWQGFPLVLCERMHLSSHLAGRYGPAKLWLQRQILRLAYRRADIILGVSSGVTDDLIANFSVDPARARTIFNPYPLDLIAAEAAKPPEIDLPERYFVAVGRLNHAKNLAQLIEAYGRAQIPQHLVILGEGEERPRLEALIARLGLGERVRLVGFMRNPFAIVGRAEAYVSASLNEGFPNAMVEAMVLGRPVLASDCPSGPAEILAGRALAGSGALVEARFGLLTPLGDLEALSRGLVRLSALEVRARLGKQARQRAETFTAPVVTAQYWSLFDDVAKRRGSVSTLTTTEKATRP